MRRKIGASFKVWPIQTVAAANIRRSLPWHWSAAKRWASEIGRPRLPGIRPGQPLFELSPHTINYTRIDFRQLKLDGCSLVTGWY